MLCFVRVKDIIYKTQVSAMLNDTKCEQFIELAIQETWQIAEEKESCITLQRIYDTHKKGKPTTYQTTREN